MGTNLGSVPPNTAEARDIYNNTLIYNIAIFYGVNTPIMPISTYKLNITDHDCRAPLEWNPAHSGS